MLCRLCLKDEQDTLDIFSSFSYEISMAEIIGKHFSFEPKPGDTVSNVICKDCWSKVHDFHEFHELVEDANRRYFILKNNVLVKKEDDEEADEACMDSLPVDVQILVEPVQIKNEDPVISQIADEQLIDEPMNFSSYSDSSEAEIDVLEQRDKETDKIHISPKRKVKRKPRKQSGKEDRDTDNDENLPLSKLKQKNCKRKPRKKSTQSKSDDQDDDSDTNDEANDSKNGDEVEPKKPKPPSRRSRNSEKKLRKIDEVIAKNCALVCDVCETKAETFAKLVRHMRKEHNVEKGYVFCCREKYTIRQKLYDHVLLHIDPDCYKCPHCSRILGNDRSLRQHIMTKHQPDETKPFQCKDCFKRYATGRLLNRHAIKHAERVHVCEKCQKAFPTQYMLTQHTKISHEGYGIMCDICAKIYPGRAAFEKHQLKHKGIVLPKLQCDICFTWHKDKDCLRMHRSRHNQEGKLHMCGFCGKVAPNRIAMLKHQRDVHTSKKKFPCTFCEKSFKRAIHLKEHITSHTGEALYSCPHCSRAFNNSGNMHSHRKKMHPKEFEEARRTRLEMRKMAPTDNEATNASPPEQEETKT